ncbi:MAG: hypothetical protein ABL874_11980 [Sphingopyxis sp.]
MTSQSDDYYLNKIGQIAIDEALCYEKILIYAEVEDATIEVSFFFKDPVGKIIYKFASEKLEDSIYKFWKYWQTIPGNREWRCFIYAIDDGKFTLDLKYPDQIDDTKTSFSRRPSVILEHFGDAEIDYSNPEDGWALGLK